MKENPAKRLTENFLAARVRGEGEAWYNPNADVTVMAKHMLEQLSAALRANAWPEIEKLLRGVSTSDTPEEFLEEVRKVHNTYHLFVKSCNEPTAEQQSHESFAHTLDDLGWTSLCPAARTAYMHALGNYFTGLLWTVFRQMYGLGLAPPASAEDIMRATGIESRLFDQDIDPLHDAAEVLRTATRYAFSLGLRHNQAVSLVEQIYLDPESSKSMPDLSPLARMNLKDTDVE